MDIVIWDGAGSRRFHRHFIFATPAILKFEWKMAIEGMATN